MIPSQPSELSRVLSTPAAPPPNLSENGDPRTLERAPERPWTACPCCGSTEHRHDYDFSISTNPSAVPGLIVTCRACGLQFKIPARPDVPLDAYYADTTVYQFRDDESEADKEFVRILELAGRELGTPRNARLLDVGSGPGHFLRTAVRAGYRATGVELNPGLAKLAAEASGAEMVAGDALALPRLLVGRERSFDVVTLLDVIEHVRTPVQLLRDAATFVAPGGVLLIYTPNHAGLITRTAAAIRHLTFGRVEGPLRGIYDCDHIVFFAPDTLRDAVRRAGLVPGRMTMVKFNPYRRGIARGVTAEALRLIECASPWIGGEFRMALAIRPA